MKMMLLYVLIAGLIGLTKIEETREELYCPNYSIKSYEAMDFVKKNKMDSTVCFLIDMKVHSGKKRFAIWDLVGDSALREIVVSHGSAGAKGLEFSEADKPIFSNIPSSYASSLGRYRIGKRSYSNWGINVHYKLHGLDSTNNNAFKRIIVLHSFIGVNQSEVYPEEAPYSLGCPMVSNEDMTYLDELLKTKKNVLMWIYYQE
ncbi:MAG: peptidase [Flavobacteriales bacterium]|nr:peptidase [Flavobacteriales bacterium]MBO72698.1 peptidase [Flavobacteriales bacterium]